MSWKKSAKHKTSANTSASNASAASKSGGKGSSEATERTVGVTASLDSSRVIFREDRESFPFLVTQQSSAVGEADRVVRWDVVPMVSQHVPAGMGACLKKGCRCR